MPVIDATVQQPITTYHDVTIGEALATIEKHNVRAVPVIDREGRLVGMISLHELLRGLLPISVTMQDGLEDLSFVQGAAPGVAKRLRKLEKRLVSEVMVTDIRIVTEDLPIWEALRLLCEHGSPLPVVSCEDKRELKGIISEASALAVIKRIAEEAAEDV